MNFPNINQEGCHDTKVECPKPGDISLIVKPETILTCPGGEVQFTAYLRTPQGEVPVAAGVSFQSTNPSVLSVDAGTGLGQMVAAGTAIVSVAWQEEMAFSHITLLGAGGTCCDDVVVATAVLIDNSLSMGLPLNEIYSKLDAAKVISKSFTDLIRVEKDLVGLFSFATYGKEILALGQVLPSISDYAQVEQTESATLIPEALNAAILALDATVSLQKVIVLFSDGENQPPLNNAQRDSIITSAKAFRQAGGIIIVVGLRAFGDGYDLLQKIASAGYFINLYGQGNVVVSNASSSLIDMLAYFCGAPDSTVQYMYLYDTEAAGLPLGAQLPDPLPMPCEDEPI